jgi:hypothetical protein
VGVLALHSDNFGSFQGHVFLGDRDIDQDDRPDDRSLGPSFYFVLGYSASRTQVNVSRAEHRIFQMSFHCVTSPVTPAEYTAEEVAEKDHILLEFDHREILVGGSRANPPRLQGASGGGIFHVARSTMEGPLVAIATQNRRNSWVILGTRIKHFLGMARKVKFRMWRVHRFDRINGQGPSQSIDSRSLTPQFRIPFSIASRRVLAAAACTTAASDTGHATPIGRCWSVVTPAKHG